MPKGMFLYPNLSPQVSSNTDRAVVHYILQALPFTNKSGPRSVCRLRLSSHGERDGRDDVLFSKHFPWFLGRRSHSSLAFSGVARTSVVQWDKRPFFDCIYSLL